MRDGRRWRCFELPEAGLTGGSGPTAEVVHLTLIGRDGHPLDAKHRGLGGVAPSSPFLATEPMPEDDSAPDGSAWVIASKKAEELVGRHLDLINGTATTRQSPGAGTGRVTPRGLRSGRPPASLLVGERWGAWKNLRR